MQRIPGEPGHFITASGDRIQIVEWRTWAETVDRYRLFPYPEESQVIVSQIVCDDRGLGRGRVVIHHWIRDEAGRREARVALDLGVSALAVARRLDKEQIDLARRAVEALFGKVRNADALERLIHNWQSFLKMSSRVPWQDLLFRGEFEVKSPVPVHLFGIRKEPVFDGNRPMSPVTGHPYR